MKKKKILIYQVGVIGDTIVALPAVRAILQRHSSDEVHILNLHYSQKNFQLDLLKDLPENKEKVEFEYFQSIKTVSGFISRIKLFSKIRKEKYDIAYMIILYGVAKSLLKTFRYFTGIKQIFYTEHFRKKSPCLLDSLVMQFEDYGFQFDKTQKLLEYPLSPAHLKTSEDYIKKLNIPAGKIPVAVCITAVTQEKFSWPGERFLTVLKKIIPEYQLYPLFVGSPKEKDYVQSFIDELQTGAFVSDLKVTDLLALLKKCKFYLGNDTGPMHLADSAGIPCITLFSHRDYYQAWFPEGKHHINLIHCQPCGECHLQECKFGSPAKCIQEITEEEVLDAVKKVTEN